MNVRIAKEIRAQAPMFGLMAAFAVATPVIQTAQAPFGFINTQSALVLLYISGCSIMAATAFGGEFQNRTMSLLLSQPIARRTVWREKMLVLVAVSAIAVLIALGAQVVCDLVIWQDPIVPSWFLLPIAIVLFCTTPCLTLISKSAIGGIVFTILGVGILGVLSGAIADRVPPVKFGLSILDNMVAWIGWRELVFIGLSMPYAAMFYLAGRKKFMRMEVVDSQSQELSLPAIFEIPFERLSAACSSASGKLWLKELRLQRISLLLSVIFCGLVACEFIAQIISPGMSGTYFAGTIGIYMGLFPIMAGVTAVAEEKSWGLKDWHLTLPLAVGKQWRAKWVTAFGLSLLLGLALPVLFSRVSPWPKDVGFDESQLELLLMVDLFVTVIALYAASLSNSSMRALLLTMGLLSLVSLSASNTTTWIFNRIGIGDVFTSMVGDVYFMILWGMWHLLVMPVWLITHSVEQTRPISMWADMSANNHLPNLLIAAYACLCLGLVLRFARTNYRHSDLVRNRVVRQIVAMLLLAIIMGIIFKISNERPRFNDLPKWIQLP